MAKRTISNEALKQWLGVFFPNGYGESRKGDEPLQQWYIGWLKVGGASILDYPCEINLDAGGSAIVFKWWHNGDTMYSNNELSAYIEGVMSQLAPDMALSMPQDDSSLVMFEFKED